MCVEFLIHAPLGSCKFLAVPMERIRLDIREDPANSGTIAGLSFHNDFSPGLAPYEGAHDSRSRIDRWQGAGHAIKAVMADVSLTRRFEIVKMIQSVQEDESRVYQLGFCVRMSCPMWYEM